jgi:hypothetical protein
MDEDRELKQKLASTLQTLLGHFAQSGKTVRILTGRRHCIKKPFQWNA